MDALTERARPRWGRLLKRVLVIVVGAGAAIVVLLLLVSADARYVARAGIEEARILLRRRSIEKLLADSTISPALRQRLRLVLEARRYAADSLGLAVGATYTTYVDVGRDTLLLVLSASRHDKLREVTWTFPIVGVVPYKGFFSAERARRAGKDLAAQGLDVYLRPSGAFSTLGYFSDPLFSTAMSRDTMELVATVLHELAHNTLYVKSQTPFNESFASFVGYRGAQAFFRSRRDTTDARRARLDSAYAESPSGDKLERTRTTLFGWARTQLTGPVGQSLETYDWRWFAQSPLNNAVVIAQRLYRMDLNLFDEIYLQSNADIAETIRAIQIRVFTQADRDPYRALYSRPGMRVED